MLDRRRRQLALVGLVGVLVVGACVPACARRGVRLVPAARIGRFAHGAVSSLSPDASRAGAEILAAGGTAMDAAVAAALVVAVTEQSATSIGGGGFLLYHRARGRVDYALDFRERAPRGATLARYQRNGRAARALTEHGPLSVAVPGLVAGLHAAHRRFGRLPWSRVMAPAIRAAAMGHRVSDRLAAMIRLRAPVLNRYRGARDKFLPGGEPLAPGARLRHPALARTLRHIAARGPAAFYRGAIAKRIAAAVREGGGLLDAGDLAAYRPRWRAPIRGFVRGVEVVSVPPPSGGGVLLLQMLGVLERDSLPKLDAAARAHLLVETMRRSYRDRARYLGDPDVVRVPLGHLLDPARLVRWRRSIDPRRATPTELPPRPRGPPAPGNTTHLSVVDAAGNAVSMTQSCNNLFGSGILLNNTMDDFSLGAGLATAQGMEASRANAVAPGKAPLSAMAPTFVHRGGRLWLVLGSPGGPTITTTVMQVILGRVAGRRSLDAAVRTPRLHHQWYPDEVRLEPALHGDAALRAALTARGHKLVPVASIGNVNAIEIAPSGERRALADGRRQGASAGY